MKSRASLAGLLMALALSSVGCATSELWGDKTYRPVSITALKLSPTSTNILVIYQEKRFSSMMPDGAFAVSRAWLLTNSASTNSPAFVNPTNFADWISIPLVDVKPYGPIWLTESVACGAVTNHYCYYATNKNSALRCFVTNAPPARGYYMPLPTVANQFIVAPDVPPTNGYYAASLGGRFTLWRDGQLVGNYTTPEYAIHPQCNWWRVALTPVAVTYDTACVCLLVAVCVAVNAPPVPLR
jgi:hypothetical protein